MAALTIAMTAAPAPARAQMNRWNVMSSCKAKQTQWSQPLTFTNEPPLWMLIEARKAQVTSNTIAWMTNLKVIHFSKCNNVTYSRVSFGRCTVHASHISIWVEASWDLQTGCKTEYSLVSFFITAAQRCASRLEYNSTCHYCSVPAGTPSDLKQ